MITRRTFLKSGAAISAFFAVPALAYGAPTLEKYDSFVTLSQRLTGHEPLNPLTAKRIFDAMEGDNNAFVDACERLYNLSETLQDPQQIVEQAESQGLKPVCLAIIAAWYKGTVDTANGPVVVAYYDALMYKPVADGLIVPTYAQKGPLYWKDTLPPGITHRPVNHPAIL